MNLISTRFMSMDAQLSLISKLPMIMKPDTKISIGRSISTVKRESIPIQTKSLVISTPINTKDSCSRHPRFWTLWSISRVIKYLSIAQLDAVEDPLSWSFTSQCSADTQIGITSKAWNSLLKPATQDLLQICSPSCKFSMTTKPIDKNNLHFVRKKKERRMHIYLKRRDRQDSTLSRGSWRRLARRDSSRKMLTSRDTNISRSIKTIGKKEMAISLLIMKTSGRESTTMNLLVSKL